MCQNPQLGLFFHCQKPHISNICYFKIMSEPNAFPWMISQILVRILWFAYYSPDPLWQVHKWNILKNASGPSHLPFYENVSVLCLWECNVCCVIVIMIYSETICSSVNEADVSRSLCDNLSCVNLDIIKSNWKNNPENGVVSYLIIKDLLNTSVLFIKTFWVVTTIRAKSYSLGN